jgi:DNA-binding NarL/FixJ family response regulator
MDEEPIRVLIADDHPMLRKGLRLTIEEDPGLSVVGEAADGEAALALLAKLRPDVAVLDIEMPKLDGLAVAREAMRQGLALKTIFLTLHMDEDMFNAALELGSKGYILKDSAAQEIVAGVRAVAAGRPYFSSAIAAQMLNRRDTPGRVSKGDLARQLSPTERRIMQLIANGKSSKEIGSELSIHYRTVENHRTNICRKLALDGEGANALLRFALQNKSSWQVEPR